MELNEILKQLEIKGDELGSCLFIEFSGITEWSEITDKEQKEIKFFETHKELFAWLKPVVHINTTRDNLIKAMKKQNILHYGYDNNIRTLIESEVEVDLLLAVLKDIEQE